MLARSTTAVDSADRAAHQNRAGVFSVGRLFDVRTGKNLTPPAPQEVPSYEVRIEGSDIQVEIP